MQGRIPGQRDRPFFSPSEGGPAPGSQDLHIREIPGSGFSPKDPEPGTGGLPTGEGFIYRGQAFGLFLIAERGDRLYLVDQHAAHERIIYDALAADQNVGPEQRRLADIACWDLHARMTGKPLHSLVGTKRDKVRRYGDVRGKQPDFSSQAYARQVATYLQRTEMTATKLHFPGAMGTADSIDFDTVKRTLREIRKATGPEPTLAWDPYPGTAESATPSMEQAREILALMTELGYEWIEGPLPPEPQDQQIPKYAELTKIAKIRVQPEGRGGMGDNSDVDSIRRWIAAGAASQFSTDAYIRDGITPILRLLDHVRGLPKDKRVTINLHWSWLPHLHIATACEAEIMPILEFPMSHEVPGEYFDKKDHVKAPDWPGLYLLKTS